MMAENVLTQEEIDALMTSVDDDDGATADKATANNKAQGKGDVDLGPDYRVDSSKDNIDSIDFANQERIVRGQFPVLERIYDRMVRAFTEDIFVQMSREMELTQEPFSILKAHEFFSTIEAPMMIKSYRMHPLRGKSLIIFDSELIFELVENFFGGHGEHQNGMGDRDLTPMEERIIEMTSIRLVEMLAEAWAPIMKVDMEYVASGTNPQLINIYSPSDLLIISRFTCKFDRDAGNFYIILPYTMIDPIREQLELGASQTDEEFDPNWTNAVKDELMRVSLTISAVLAKKHTTLKEVTKWEEGTFIPLEIKETVPLIIEGYPTFNTKVGSSNHKCALQIISRFTS